MLTQLKRLLRLEPKVYHCEYQIGQFVDIWYSDLRGLVTGQIVVAQNGLYAVATEYGWLYCDVNQLNEFNRGVLVEGVA